MRKQLLLQRVLAIAILSVCPSHRWISQKRCKLRSPNITKSSLSAAWKTLVSETVFSFSINSVGANGNYTEPKHVSIIRCNDSISISYIYLHFSQTRPNKLLNMSPHPLTHEAVIISTPHYLLST